MTNHGTLVDRPFSKHEDDPLSKNIIDVHPFNTSVRFSTTPSSTRLLPVSRYESISLISFLNSPPPLGEWDKVRRGGGWRKRRRRGEGKKENQFSNNAFAVSKVATEFTFATSSSLDPRGGSAHTHRRKRAVRNSARHWAITTRFTRLCLRAWFDIRETRGIGVYTSFLRKCV